MEETSVQSAVVLLERRISRGDALAAGARTSARYLEVSIADTEVALDERGNVHTNYRVSAGGKVVKRRYVRFVELHNKLKRVLAKPGDRGDLPKLPGRRLLGGPMGDELLRKRCGKLTVYLQNLVKMGLTNDAVYSILSEFLEIPEVAAAGREAGALTPGGSKAPRGPDVPVQCAMCLKVINASDAITADPDARPSPGAAATAVASEGTAAGGAQEDAARPDERNAADADVGPKFCSIECLRFHKKVRESGLEIAVAADASKTDTASLGTHHSGGGADDSGGIVGTSSSGGGVLRAMTNLFTRKNSERSGGLHGSASTSMTSRKSFSASGRVALVTGSASTGGVNSAEVVMEGFLWKRGGFRGGRKNWKRRLVVLKGQSLYYYRTSRPVLLGTMQLCSLGMFGPGGGSAAGDGMMSGTGRMGGPGAAVPRHHGRIRSADEVLSLSDAIRRSSEASAASEKAVRSSVSSTTSVFALAGGGGASAGAGSAGVSSRHMPSASAPSVATPGPDLADISRNIYFAEIARLPSTDADVLGLPSTMAAYLFSVKTRDRTLYLCAETPEARDEWIMSIKHLLHDQRKLLLHALRSEEIAARARTGDSTGSLRGSSAFAKFLAETPGGRRRASTRSGRGSDEADTDGGDDASDGGTLGSLLGLSHEGSSSLFTNFTDDLGRSLVSGEDPRDGGRSDAEAPNTSSFRGVHKLISMFERRIRTFTISRVHSPLREEPSPHSHNALGRVRALSDEAVGSPAFGEPAGSSGDDDGVDDGDDGSDHGDDGGHSGEGSVDGGGSNAGNDGDGVDEGGGNAADGVGDGDGGDAAAADADGGEFARVDDARDHVQGAGAGAQTHSDGAGAAGSTSILSHDRAATSTGGSSGVLTHSQRAMHERLTLGADSPIPEHGSTRSGDEGSVTASGGAAAGRTADSGGAASDSAVAGGAAATFDTAASGVGGGSDSTQPGAAHKATTQSSGPAEEAIRARKTPSVDGGGGSGMPMRREQSDGALTTPTTGKRTPRATSAASGSAAREAREASAGKQAGGRSTPRASGRHGRRTSTKTPSSRERDKEKRGGRSTSAASGAKAGKASKTKDDDADEADHWAVNESEIEVLQRIGHGTYGDVFKGRLWGSDVAVKLLHTLSSTGGDVTAALKQEVDVLASLRHPNVLLYMGACTAAPNMFIVTEWCERGSLYDILYDHKTPMSALVRVAMALDAARGMAYLHSRPEQIIHRDLKSHNLLVTKELVVKVADFGLTVVRRNPNARAENAAELVPRTKGGDLDGGGSIASVTSSASVAAAEGASEAYGVEGTPQWMAPEVMEGQRYNHKVDVYSFGIVLCELVSRIVPFSDKFRRFDFIDAVLEEGVIPTLPKWIDASVFSSAGYDDGRGRRRSSRLGIISLQSSGSGGGGGGGGRASPALSRRSGTFAVPQFSGDGGGSSGGIGVGGRTASGETGGGGGTSASSGGGDGAATPRRRRGSSYNLFDDDSFRAAIEAGPLSSPPQASAQRLDGGGSAGGSGSGGGGGGDDTAAGGVSSALMTIDTSDEQLGDDSDDEELGAAVIGGVHEWDVAVGECTGVLRYIIEASLNRDPHSRPHFYEIVTMLRALADRDPEEVFLQLEVPRLREALAYGSPQDVTMACTEIAHSATNALFESSSIVGSFALMPSSSSGAPSMAPRVELQALHRGAPQLVAGLAAALRRADYVLCQQLRTPFAVGGDALAPPPPPPEPASNPHMPAFMRKRRRGPKVPTHEDRLAEAVSVCGAAVTAVSALLRACGAGVKSLMLDNATVTRLVHPLCHIAVGTAGASQPHSHDHGRASPAAPASPPPSAAAKRAAMLRSQSSHPSRTPQRRSVVSAVLSRARSRTTTAAPDRGPAETGSHTLDLSTVQLSAALSVLSTIWSMHPPARRHMVEVLKAAYACTTDVQHRHVVKGRLEAWLPDVVAEVCVGQLRGSDAGGGGDGNGGGKGTDVADAIDAAGASDDARPSIVAPTPKAASGAALLLASSADLAPLSQRAPAADIGSDAALASGAADAGRSLARLGRATASTSPSPSRSPSASASAVASVPESKAAAPSAPPAAGAPGSGAGDGDGDSQSESEADEEASMRNSRIAEKLQRIALLERELAMRQAELLAELGDD